MLFSYPLPAFDPEDDLVDVDDLDVQVISLKHPSILALFQLIFRMNEANCQPDAIVIYPDGPPKQSSTRKVADPTSSPAAHTMAAVPSW